MLTRMLSKIAALEGAVAATDARRREIHNQLVELKGNVRRGCGVLEGDAVLCCAVLRWWVAVCVGRFPLALGAVQCKKQSQKQS
jgi:hypothetical protein